MMGNKTSRSPCERPPTKTTKTVRSDEGYIPMTSAMIKAMIEGRRFHHVIPSTMSLTDKEGLNTLKTTNLRKTDSNPSNEKVNVDTYSTKSVTFINLSRPNSKPEKVKHETVKSGQDTSDDSSKSSRKSIVTIIDQKKSKFTLQLEKRLRQSKLELGFDTDLDSLKEFVYKYEDTEFKKKMGSLKRKKKKSRNVIEADKSPESQHNLIYKPSKTHSKSTIKSVKHGTILQGSSKFIASVPLNGNDCKSKKHSYFDFNKSLITHTSDISIKSQSKIDEGKPTNDQAQKTGTKYCSHSCQVLGLCSVGRPQITKPAKSFIPNISNHLEESNDDVKINGLQWKGGKHDKNYCNCELCTLAYLTDMGFPKEYRTPSPSNKQIIKPYKRSGNPSSKNGNKDIERIRILECGDSYRAVDVSVNDRASHKGFRTETSDEDNSKGSQSTLHQDSTNKKIRKMFEQNNIPVSINHTYRGKLDTGEIFVKGKNIHSDLETNFRQLEKGHLGQLKAKVENIKNMPSESSSSVLTASQSSSLSTVMSYKRVRLLFQTIINKNKSRIKTRKNINKFIEMEELGLGTLKNNRWYPSGDKTYSIWNNMHSKVNGVQAEFKKYPKTSIKASS